MPDGTPAGWRLAAGATLAGGLALGFAAAADRRTGRMVLGVIAAGLATTVPIAVASRKPLIPPRDALRSAAPAGTAAGFAFTIVVAARDEAAVVPRLIADIAAQDHRTADGGPLFELVLIDDRSVDGTGESALRSAAAAGLEEVTRVVRREGEGLPDGKGAALTALDPSAYLGDIVVVLDADARLGPRFLSTLAHYVVAGASAITARRRILNADSSWLARAQADEQTIDGEIQRGRWAMGGLSEFRGNGIVVSRDLLIEVGGWRAEALTEDVDLASRIAAARGHGVAWAIDAEVWEEPVRTWPALWRQRVRWAEGGIRRLLEHGPAVLGSPALPLRAKLDFAAYGGQVAAPGLIVGAVAGSVIGGRSGTAVGLLGAYAGVAAGLGWDALRWEQRPDGSPLLVGERARRAIAAAAFGCVWIAAVPAALWRLAIRRGPVVYDKMVHDGAS